MTRALTCVATLILIGAAPFSTANESSPAAPLLAWNDRVLAVAQAEDGLLTLKGLRTVTMMHLAIHDALANIDHRYASYRYDEQIRSPDRVVAIVQAAYVVAVDQYPDQREMFTALRDRWLPQGSMSTANKDAIELGTATAQAILDLRRGDEWDAEVEYQWHPMGPGVYAEFADHSGTPEGFVFGSGWARARPFALERPDQFRSPPPPSIDSQEYTRAFKEVKQNGRFQSMSRSVDQTHLAMWWKDFAENSHNRLARDLVTKENLDLGVAARLFALLNMSIYDAYVNVFDN
ncbi:MAG: hypothetical protein KDI09_21405, partial [Halioglobus sp.]|nr:hypothetical protein [Halioglobus sp.]